MKSADPRAAASRVIEEIDAALTPRVVVSG
jgi:hypothetical protein